MLINSADDEYALCLPEVWNGITDVIDVAQAHKYDRRLERVKGRHLIINKSIPLLEIADILKKEHGGGYPFPKCRGDRIEPFLVKL